MAGMTALMPLYARKVFGDDPHFSDAKIIFSAYNDGFPGSLDKDFMKKIQFDGIAEEDVAMLKDPTFNNLSKLAIEHSDAIIQATPELHDDISSYITDTEKPFLNVGDEDNFIPEIDHFYDSVLEGKSVLIEE